MLKLGFVDHHLNNFHANTFLKLLRGPLAGEGVEVALAWESDPTGDDWCAANGVRRAASAEEVAHGSDAVLVLAPDNVDEHPRLAQAVLPAGKPTVMDKFLAPTSAEAEGIVALARQHGAPLFSASALRYAVELEDVLPALSGGPVREVYAGGLAAWDGYGVHTLAMALRVMGPGVRRLIDTGTATARTVMLDCGDGRRALVDVRTAENEWDLLGWRFLARAGDRYVGATIKDFEGFYANLMRHVAGFAKTGEADMTVEEALTVVRVLEGANRSLAAGGEWVAAARV